jgi:tetratricopeptide (TPR) repeat protein
MVGEVLMSFRTRIVPSALLALLLAAPAFAQDAPPASPPGLFSRILRSFWLQAPPGKQGNKAYGKGDYEGALRKYAQADAEDRAGGRPADPALPFNAGNALYKQKRYAEAAEAYGQALRHLKGPLKTARDSAFAARAHYNLGNAHYQKGAAADSIATDQAIGDLREALARYKKNLQLDPENRDAKHNLERAQTLLQQLLKRQEQQKKNAGDPKQPEPSKRAQEALARALQLAQERRYAEAKAVLEDILRADPTAASYRSHLKRLEDVIQIQKGQTPAPLAPRDPRGLQKGLGI